MLGPQDLWIALALGVFFFGAKKLPELSRSLGQAMSEFKKGVAGGHDEPAPSASEKADATDAKENTKTDVDQGR
jgi:sec-independent protein translocase protein TatA